MEFTRFPRLLALCALALHPAGPAFGQGFGSLDPLEQKTMMEMHVLLTAVEAYREATGSYPGTAGGYTTTDSLRPLLEPVYLDRVPVQDGWGQPILYGFDAGEASVVSYGADGIPALVYGTILTEPATDAGDDLVWTGGRILHAPAQIRLVVDHGAQKRTMADMRSIGTTVESYRIDNGSLPGPTDGYVPVDYLRPHVQPIYIRALPSVDGWENSILFWSDGEHYRIVSNGRDGRADRPYEEVVAGSTIDGLDGDILFGDGVFIQAPQGLQ